MATKTRNMTEGKPLELIVTFALPLMLGYVFQQMYAVVDAMVVGRALHVQALAAVGASEWLNWMILGLLYGMTQGFSIQMSQEFGASNFATLRKTAGNAAILTAAIALVLTAFSISLLPLFLKLLQTPEAITPLTIEYASIIYYGLIASALYNYLAGILRAMGDSKTPLQAMIVASLVNIGLDLLFVLKLHMGVSGAAIATIIAQGVSACYCMYHVSRIPFMTMEKSDFRLDSKLCARLLKLGTPISFQNAIIAVGGMIVQAVVNGFGVIFVAGYTATNKMFGLLEMAATSYGFAVSSYTGQNMGAGRIDRIRSGMKAAVLVSLVTSAAIAAAILPAGRWIISQFLSGTPEEVAQAIDVGYEYLLIMGLCLPVLYILHIVRSAVQGMGDTVRPMLSGISEFIMRTAGALILPIFMGGTGLFVAEVAAWFGADFVLLPSFFTTLRKVSRQNAEQNQKKC